RGRRDDVVARKGQLESAAEADAVNARDQRDRQQFHEAQEFDAAQSPTFACLICGICRDPFVENIQVCPSGKVAQSASDHDGTTTCLLRRLHLLHQRVHEFRAEQIVWPIDHSQNGDVATLFARHDHVLRHSCLLCVSAALATATLLSYEYHIMTRVLQVIDC